MRLRTLHILMQSAILILSVWLVNQLSGAFRFRLDLTEDQRYTLANSTKELLSGLDEDVYFEVYLAGDLPSNFERFRKSIGEILDQFAEISGNRVFFKFVDPSQAANMQARNQFYQSLIDKGVQPTNLSYKNESGDMMEKLIFPGAIVSQGMAEGAVNLLNGNSAAGPEIILNQSIENLEYELASAIAQLSGGGIKRVGYITGHGSPDSLEIAGFRNAVLSKYDLFNISLEAKKELLGYDAVVVAKPSRPFSEREKYLLDQYVMRGGNLIFFIDALSVNYDSIFGEGTAAIPRELNLTDLLFRYGVRVNANYVLDVNSGQFPVVTGNIGNQPQIQMIPWPFYPVLTNFSNHPSVRNLDAVLGQFISEVDTVKADGIEKIPLITTSAYTKVLGPPVKVAFNDLRSKLLPDRFTDGPKTVGYLLEGSFRSLYANRLVPKGFDSQSFISSGEKARVVVFGDGDIIRNEIDPETGDPLGLGVEPFTNNTYANEAFILNLIDYLVDDSGLMETRLREVKIRPLDRVKLQQKRTQIQIINMVGPIVLILILGALKWYFRRKKYAGS